MRLPPTTSTRWHSPTSAAATSSTHSLCKPRPTVQVTRTSSVDSGAMKPPSNDASSELTDQQQTRRRAIRRSGRPMDAGWHAAAGILDRDAPQIADAKGERRRTTDWCIVQVEAVVGQPSSECLIIHSAKLPKQ